MSVTDALVEPVLTLDLVMRDAMGEPSFVEAEAFVTMPFVRGPCWSGAMQVASSELTSVISIVSVAGGLPWSQSRSHRDTNQTYVRNVADFVSQPAINRTLVR